MKGAKQHNSHALKRLHRTIESRFSILVDNYGIERNLTRLFIGFWLKIELTVFVNNLVFLVSIKMKLLRTTTTRLKKIKLPVVLLILSHLRNVEVMNALTNFCVNFPQETLLKQVTTEEVQMIKDALNNEYRLILCDHSAKEMLEIKPNKQ